VEETGGLQPRFVSAEALVSTVDAIAKGEGFGRVLAEASARAADRLGGGRELVVASKGPEFPAHMPQHKRSLALIYVTNPFGADYQSHEHDPFYSEVHVGRLSELGLSGALPETALGADKIRFAYYTQLFYAATDSCVCQSVYGPSWLWSRSRSSERWCGDCSAAESAIETDRAMGRRPASSAEGAR
jgi:aldehyde:ferredoxin oxidoreductase